MNRIGEELRADADWGSRILAAPRATHTSRGESGSTLHLSAQVRSLEAAAVRAELLERVTTALEAADIRLTGS